MEISLQNPLFFCFYLAKWAFVDVEFIIYLCAGFVLLIVSGRMLMSEESSFLLDTGALLSEESLYALDAGALFHCLLFAYQKAVKEILGSGCSVFVHPTLDLLKKIDMKRNLNLIKGKNLDETWRNLSEFFLKANLVKEFSFRKTGPRKYVLRVNGCLWARHIHEELKPKDVTCPYALIAMAAFEKATGKRVKLADSKYLKEGTETIIESM